MIYASRGIESSVRKPRPRLRKAVTRTRAGYTRAVSAGTRAADVLTPHNVLMTEYVICVLLIGIRGIADYKQASDPSQPGTESAAKNTVHPLTMITALTAVFFVLSVVSQSDMLKKISASFGALVTLVLFVRSESEFNTVAEWFAKRGPATPVPHAPGNAPSTTTPVYDAPASSSSSSSSSSGGST